MCRDMDAGERRASLCAGLEQGLPIGALRWAVALRWSSCLGVAGTWHFYSTRSCNKSLCGRSRKAVRLPMLGVVTSRIFATREVFSDTQSAVHVDE